MRSPQRRFWVSDFSNGPRSSLLLTDHHPLDRWRQFTPFALRKAGVAKHSFEFGKGVRIAGRRAPKHHQTESRGLRRRYSIRVRNKLKCNCSATVGQRTVDFTQKHFTSRRIEVMKKVRQQHYVIAGAIIHIKGTTEPGVI